MREIPLTQGKFALVDDADFAWLNQWKWHAHSPAKGLWYAVRTSRKDGRKTMVRMHRLILNPPAGMEPDHRNGDGLDNRRCNLRNSTHAENLCNQRVFSGKVSTFKGVGWDKNCWRSRITVDGQTLNLGRFKSEIKAALAYDKAAKKHFGEFARTNREVE